MTANLLTFNLGFSKSVATILLIIAIVFNSVFVFTLLPKTQEAKAFLPTFNVTEMIMAAIKRIIFNFVTNAIQSAFSFVMNKIQNNFLVKNFLRYDAVLTDKRYYTDYLTGNFPEGDMGFFLRDFTYQINSGGRGYDPSIHREIVLRVNANGGSAFADPLSEDYISRLKNLTNVWTNPTMIFFGMQDQALKAQSEAKRASALNLTSDGLKTSFEELGGTASDTIKVGTNTLSAAEEQAINAVYRHMSLAPETSGASFSSLVGDALGNSISSFLFDFLNDKFDGGFVFRDDIPSYPPRFELRGDVLVQPEDAALPTDPVPEIEIPSPVSSCQTDPVTGEEECSYEIHCQNNPALCF